MEYSNEQLLERVKNLPTFDGWPSSGVLDIWVRSKADKFNLFDDKVYTFDCSSGSPVFETVCTGTSNAGSFGLANFRKWNPKGCAVLLADTVIYNSHVYGLHKGKPAYVQNYNNPFPYTRDNDRDQKSENFGIVYTDVIGANCHRAGRFSRFIANWSVGCLVRNDLSAFLKWLAFMDRRPLSVAILNEF